MMKSNRQGKTWAAAVVICAAVAGLWLLGRSEPREEVPEPSALPPARPEGDGETAPGQKLRDALRRTAQTRQTLEAALARAEGTGGAKDAAEACRLFQLSTYQLLGPTLLPVFPTVGLNPDEALEELVRPRAEAGDPSAQAAAALIALHRGEPGKAAATLKPLAERGDLYARVLLGYCLSWGDDEEAAAREAALWFRRALDVSDNENSEAGTLVDVDAFFRREAEAGHAAAQAFWADRLMRGAALGEQTSRTEAAEWYRQAAEQGYARAQYKLASLYAEGVVLPPSAAEAERWAAMAAEQGLPEAAELLRRLREDQRELSEGEGGANGAPQGADAAAEAEGSDGAEPDSAEPDGEGEVSSGAEATAAGAASPGDAAS